GECWGKVLCTFLELLERNHCANSLDGRLSPPDQGVAMVTGAGLGVGGGALLAWALTGPIGLFVAVGASFGVLLGIRAASATCSCGCESQASGFGYPGVPMADLTRLFTWQ